MLTIEDLSIEFYPGDPGRSFHAVRDVDLTVQSGQTVGVVGESGCGKSLTALSILNLLPETARARGTITFDGQSYPAGSDDLNGLRGRRVGMIFQEPMSALDPLFTVGEQLSETLNHHFGLSRDEIQTRSLELLRRVDLNRPEQRLDQYPHELSGGQRQRAMIAIALAPEPELLIADEPTTALDVTVEKRIMNLFGELAGQGLSILMISHDIPLIGGVSDRLAIMYSGYTVEWGPAKAVLETPQHPYTEGLLASSVGLTGEPGGRLPVVEGEVPDPKNRPSGCPFHPRCPEREDRCEEDFPPVFQPHESIRTACWARE